MFARFVFHALLRHTWLFFVLIGAANALIWHLRARKTLPRDSIAATEFQRLLRGWLLYQNLPWLVMGLGLELGAVPNFTYFLNPRHGPFVLLFFASVLFLWAATIYWLFKRHGAEQLIAYRQQFGISVRSTAFVKVYIVLGILGGVVAVSAMAYLDLPPIL